MRWFMNETVFHISCLSAAKTIWVSGGNLTKVILNPVARLAVLIAVENVVMFTG